MIVGETGQVSTTPCLGCGQLMRQVEVEAVTCFGDASRSRRTWWNPTRHRAPCGAWCKGGGIGSEQAKEAGGMSAALDAAHRKFRCVRCKPGKASPP